MNTLRTPSQDAQRLSDKSLSHVQLAAEQPELPKEKTKKKKSHGNRKEQHKRSRLRRRQQKQQQQEQMEQDEQSPSEQIQIMLIDGRDQETREENKRKRPDSNQGDLNVSRSLSQLSISRANQPKKKQKKNMKENVPTTTAEQSSERQPSKTKQKKKDRTLKSRYLQVSDQIFKEMLSNAIQGGEQLVQCLNTAEKLQFIRRITGLIDQIQYFDLQRHLWNDYYKLGMKEGEWAPRVSKSFAQQHQICRTYGYPRRIIEKRQKTVQHQLERTIHELHLCQEELEQHSKQWEPSFDPNHLSQAMIDCVKKGQRRLQEEFEHRRKNLEFDAKEHQLIRTFYQCEPNAEQIELAQKIWRTMSEASKSKEHEEILRKRIYLQRPPSQLDQTINRSADDIEQLLADPMLTADQRAGLISMCSKTLTSCKFDLVTIKLQTIQSIRQAYEQLLLDLQMKLKESNWNETIKQTIESRRQLMIEWHDFHLQYRLKTFFDDAPMAFTQ